MMVSMPARWCVQVFAVVQFETGVVTCINAQFPKQNGAKPNQTNLATTLCYELHKVNRLGS